MPFVLTFRYMPDEHDEGLLDETRKALTDLRLDPAQPDPALLPGPGDATRRLRLEAGWTEGECLEIRKALTWAATQLYEGSARVELAGTAVTMQRVAERLLAMRKRWVLRSGRDFAEIAGLDLPVSFDVSRDTRRGEP